MDNIIIMSTGQPVSISKLAITGLVSLPNLIISYDGNRIQISCNGNRLQCGAERQETGSWVVGDMLRTDVKE